MTSLKSRILALLSAALVMFTMSSTSMASAQHPTASEVNYAISNISAETSKVLALVSIDVDKIYVSDIADVLTGDDLVNAKNILNKPEVQLEILTLHGVLNGVKILNGLQILTISQVLSNNNVTLQDVVAVYLFPDGNLLILCCSSC